MSDNSNGNGQVRPHADGTAAQAYAARLRNVAAVLDWAQAELASHAARQRADAGNWGFVGDLAEAEALAKRLLGHLSGGMDEARIDDALADLDDA